MASLDPWATAASLLRVEVLSTISEASPTSTLVIWRKIETKASSLCVGNKPTVQGIAFVVPAAVVAAAAAVAAVAAVPSIFGRPECLFHQEKQQNHEIAKAGRQNLRVNHVSV
jgi:hypothetical protein